MRTNDGPVEVTLTVTLAEEDDGTRLSSAFDAHPNGLFRIVFPIFIRMMRKEEVRNMQYVKAYLEASRLDSDAG